MTTSQGNFQSAQESFGSLISKAETYAKEEPLRAVSSAFALGWVLTFLPIASVVAVLLRLAVALLRPALLIFGAMRVYREIEGRNQS